MTDPKFSLLLTLAVNDDQAAALSRAGYGNDPQQPHWYAGYAEGSEDHLMPGVTVTHAEVVSEDHADRLAKLSALEAAGVDNWDGYDEAMSQLAD